MGWFSEPKNLILGPDHVQVNCSWKWIGKIFCKKILQFILLVVSHKVNCSHQKSFVTHVFVAYNSLILSYNWLLMAAIEFTQSTWFTTSKVNCKIVLYFCATSFQFTFSLQFTLVICKWSGPNYGNLISSTLFWLPT